jgi:hypothetical protein
MNTKSMLLTLVVLMTTLMAAAQDAPQKQDTLRMNYGGGRILFIIGSEKELEQMRKQDLNALVDDIRLRENRLDGSLYITLTDPSGRSYLRSGKNSTSTRKSNDDLVEEAVSSLSFDKVEPKSKNLKLRQPGVRTFTNFELGFNNYLENDRLPDLDAPYSLNALRSYNLGLNFIGKTNVIGPLFMEWGPGISFHQFRLDDPNFRINRNVGAGIVEFVEFQNIEAIRSNFNVSYLNFSFMPSLDLGWFGSKGRRKLYNNWSGYSSGGLRVGLGGYAGYRIGSRSRFEYSVNNDKNNEVERSNFYLNPFRYGLKAQVGWRGVDVFAAYDINPLFGAGRHQSDLNMISFGIIL